MKVAISLLSNNIVNRNNSFQRMILSENKFSYLTACLAVTMFLTLFVLQSCKKLDQERVVKVKTGLITDISYHSCSVGGTILDIGKNGIDQYGFCWAETRNPTIKNDKTQLGSKNTTGTFHDSIIGLSPNTIYYAKAYATNSQGTSYGDQLTFKTSMNFTNPTLSDIDGNVYNTITITTQTWMAENLKTTKYNDNTPIPLVTDINAWILLSTTPGYCWFYNDSTANKATYGALYNWYVVDSASNGGKNVCPTGWHVPTEAEWTTLISYLGGESVAGGKLKEFGTFHWLSPNTGATNESGFTALPGGYRDFNGSFYYGRSYGFWWSSTKYYWGAYYRSMGFDISSISSGDFFYPVRGFSIRCLRD